MPSPAIEQCFASLAAAGYRVTSPADASYDCAAWAAAEPERWWDPAPGSGYYWPPEVARTLSLSNLIAAFATRGYEACEDGRVDPGFEKLALYADENGWPTHVARQLPSGAWTSKLGVSEDIEHAGFEALEGPYYGKAVRFLRRPRSPAV
jgi:hypothetical protein